MLIQALEDMWAVSPDPRRDRLTVGFVTHLVSLATGVPAAEIAAPRRASHTAVDRKSVV